MPYSILAKGTKAMKGIYEENGKYKIRIWVAGKLIRRTIGDSRKHDGRVHTDNKRLAEAALAEIRNEKQSAAIARQPWNLIKKLERAKNQKSFEKAAKEYMETRVHKPSTVESYTNILECYLLPEFGKKALTQISIVDVRRFQKKLQETIVAKGTQHPHKMSATRVNLIMQVLRTILKDEHRAGSIDSDPSLPVRRVEEEKTEIHPLSQSELDSVLENIDDHYRPLFTALAYTGARPNELIALRWTDIDWQHKTIRIDKGRVRGNEGAPKTRSSKRTIPILQKTEAALLELKARTVQPKDNYVFADKKGQPINKHLDRVWNRALKKSGLLHRPSYQLRHTFATQCILKGLPLPYIAKLLGHTTIDTLVRHYAGWIDQSTPEYEDKLRQVFATDSQKLPENLTPNLTSVR